MSQGSIRAGAAFVEITLRDDKLLKGLTRATRSMKRFAGSVNAVSNKLLALGTSMAIPMGLAARSVAEFEDELAKANAILGLTDKQAKESKATILDLAAASTFTGTQVASAFSELARGGFNAQKAIAALPRVLTLARAAGADLTETTKGLIRTTNSFGLSMTELPRVVDLLATATVRSAQELEDLLEGFKLAAPLAREAGESIEDVATAISVLANAGIVGSKASTGFARIIKNLSQQGKQAQLDKVFGKDVIKIADGLGEMRKVHEILRDMLDASKDLGSQARLNIFEKAFGRGTAAALNLTTQSIEGMAKAFKDMDGNADDLAKSMLNSFGAVIRSLVNLADRIAVAFVDALDIDPSKAIKRINEFAKEVATAVSVNKELVKSVALAVPKLFALAVALKVAALGVAGLAAVTGLAAFALSGLFSILGTVVSAIIAVGGAIASVATAVGAWPIALAVFTASIPYVLALVVAIELFGDTMKQVAMGVVRLALDIKNAFGSIVSQVTESWGRMNDVASIAGWSEAIKLFPGEFKVVMLKVEAEFLKVMLTIHEGLQSMVNSFINGLIQMQRKVAGVIPGMKQAADVTVKFDLGVNDAKKDIASVEKEAKKAELSAQVAANTAIDAKRNAALVATAKEFGNEIWKSVSQAGKLWDNAVEGTLRSQKAADAKRNKELLAAAMEDQAQRKFDREKGEFDLDKALNIEGLMLRIQGIKDSISSSVLGEQAKGTFNTSAVALRQFGKMISATDSTDKKQLYELKKLNRNLEKEMASTFGSPAGG